MLVTLALRAGSRVGRSALPPLLAVLALGAAGCGGSGQSSPFDRASPSAQQIRVTIDNQNFNDVRVYALSTRGRQPLGVVSGNATREVRLEWRALEEIRFRLEFLAGDDYTTRPVNASPGDHLELYIPDNPYNTVLRRRR